MRYYSQTTGSTYLEGVHGSMPGDAIVISEEVYRSVIANPPSGKIRSHVDGLPVLIDAPPPGYAERLQSLSVIYQSDVDKYNRSFATAYLSDGPTQESKQAAIRADFENRKVKHAADIAALKAEYGVGI